MKTRQALEQDEAKTLAPYALQAAGSAGRVHREREHPYRTAFQRDHDRIIHSTAFRRLEYKTQVFVIHEGDYYRTRLTHSLEVAQIAGTVARALRLNTDLARAIALTHDLGHGPFGHSGQDALAELMERHGGFDHNLQVIRIVDQIEHKYPNFPGLNLTWELRDGVNKRRAPLDEKTALPQLSLEAQVVDLSDEIAYAHHDLDDGLTSQLITEEALKSVPLWKKMYREVGLKHPKLTPSLHRYEVIRRLIDITVTDLIRTSDKQIKTAKIRQPIDAQKRTTRTIGFSSAMKKSRIPLTTFLHKELYYHQKVVRMADKARRCLKALFGAYLEQPNQLPRHIQARFKAEDPHRVVCDYIAGMTDRFANDEYRKIFTP